MRNELDTIPIRKSIYSGFYEKKLIDIKSESIYGIFYHSAMWITVIWSIYLNPLSSDLHQFLNIFVRPIVYMSFSIRRNIGLWKIEEKKFPVRKLKSKCL